MAGERAWHSRWRLMWRLRWRLRWADVAEKTVHPVKHANARIHAGADAS